MNWNVTKAESGIRLSHYIQGKLKDKASIKSLKRALESNRCLINGSIERFASKPVRQGDTITFLPYQEEQKLILEKERILYQDDHVLIYNKPAGFTSEPSGVPSLFPQYHLIHRLDKETSGILLFAKTPKAKQSISELFKSRKIRKEYLALVDSEPEKRSGVIENYIGKVGWYQGQTLWGPAPQEKGHLAKTKWQCVQKGKRAALIRCFPVTGRTHQIRVHMKELGHPILGDAQYCRTFSCSLTPERHLLHASRIGFTHPETNQEINISAPLPPDFQSALKMLGISCVS